MRKATRSCQQRKLISLFTAAILLITTLNVLAVDECYTDVQITGTNYAWLNGRIAFAGVAEWCNRPYFISNVQWPEHTASILVFFNGAVWLILVDLDLEDPEAHREFGIVNFSDSVTPPNTGWEQVLGDFDYAGPLPQVSGGQPCPVAAPVFLEIEPLGAGGTFLDHALDLPEGEEAPAIAGKTLAASYELGEPIVVDCGLSQNGHPMTTSYVYVELYQLDLDANPISQERLLREQVRYNRDLDCYHFEIATGELTPGYYDVRLAYPNGSSDKLRIELMAP